MPLQRTNKPSLHIVLVYKIGNIRHMNIKSTRSADWSAVSRITVGAMVPCKAVPSSFDDGIHQRGDNTKAVISLKRVTVCYWFFILVLYNMVTIRHVGRNSLWHSNHNINGNVTVMERIFFFWLYSMSLQTSRGSLRRPFLVFPKIY